MRSILFLLSFCITVCVYAQEVIRIDYPTIKETITKDSTYYTNLLQRFESNDSLLTPNDYAMIYYGYSFQPSYKGSLDPTKTALNELINNRKYEDAYNLGKSSLKDNPVSLNTLYNMYYLCQALNKPEEETQSYLAKYTGLLYTISLSGDGHSEETAFKVICINDEYQLMYNYFGVEDIKGQSLINDCDVIEFKSSQHFKGKEMYFDISRSLLRMQEMLEK